MAEISWIKLKTTMFDDEKIRLIQAIPESDAILVIWIRLLVLAGKTNDEGLIYIQRNMPYTDEMLATLFGKPINTVRLALTTLENFNMIDLGTDGLIAITNWEKHQNVEGMDKVRLQAAKRNREYRERKKQQELALPHDVSVTSRDGTDIDKELDKDIDKEIDKEKDTQRKPNKRKKRVYSDDDPYYQLAVKLYQEIKRNQDIKKPNLNQWADDIRKTVELDKRSMEQVANMIEWATKDSFWGGVILSARKLREKYDTMKAQANRNFKAQQYTSGRTYKHEQITDWDKLASETKRTPEEQAALDAELNRKLKEFYKEEQDD